MIKVLVVLKYKDYPKSDHSFQQTFSSMEKAQSYIHGQTLQYEKMGYTVIKKNKKETVLEHKRYSLAKLFFTISEVR